jgi:hypothetical protein
MHSNDRWRGLYRKYIVRRADGSTKRGGKHAGCFYFVLDTYHDPFALSALRAYARACKPTHRQLAADLRALVVRRQRGQRDAD